MDLDRIEVSTLEAIIQKAWYLKVCFEHNYYVNSIILEWTGAQRGEIIIGCKLGHIINRFFFYSLAEEGKTPVIFLAFSF